MRENTNLIVRYLEISTIGSNAGEKRTKNILPFTCFSQETGETWGSAF